MAQIPSLAGVQGIARVQIVLRLVVTGYELGAVESL